MRDDRGYWPAGDDWAEPSYDGQDEVLSQPPMTEEEAEREWQRQLAQQNEYQEEDW